MFCNQNNFQLGGLIGNLQFTTGGCLKFGVCQTASVKEGDGFIDHKNWFNVILTSKQTEKFKSILKSGDEITIDGEIRLGEHNGKKTITVFVKRVVDHKPSELRHLSTIYYKMLSANNLTGISLIRNKEQLFAHFEQLVASLPQVTELPAHQPPAQNANQQSAAQPNNPLGNIDAAMLAQVLAAMQQQPAQQPVAQQPAQQPVAQQPAQQPVAQQPAQQPVAQQPAQQPVAQQSVTATPEPEWVNETTTPEEQLRNVAAQLASGNFGNTQSFFNNQ